MPKEWGIPAYSWSKLTPQVELRGGYLGNA
jgi:hypothetical protein